jgi:hypothetical protein
MVKAPMNVDSGSLEESSAPCASDSSPCKRVAVARACASWWRRHGDSHPSFFDLRKSALFLAASAGSTGSKPSR